LSIDKPFAARHQTGGLQRRRQLGAPAFSARHRVCRDDLAGRVAVDERDEPTSRTALRSAVDVPSAQ
jgi:hypothetical protein